MVYLIHSEHGSQLNELGPCNNHILTGLYDLVKNELFRHCMLQQNETEIWYGTEFLFIFGNSKLSVSVSPKGL